MTNKWIARHTVLLAFIGCICVARGQQVSHGVAAANIQVKQNDAANNTNSVTVTTTLAINQFFIRDGSSRGDYSVQIGAGFSDDVTTGVLMASVAENGRDNGEVASPGFNFCTPSIEYSRSGGAAGSYFIPIFNAPDGDEYNVNVSAAFFPYNRWIGGFARNANGTNAGPNNLFTGSPGLALGTHFVDHGGGISTVNLTGLGIDSRTDGVLLVTHGKNEDNFALSSVNTTNGTWTVYVKDNGSDGDAHEQDPLAFVFIPKTNTTVISGRFRQDGTPLLFSGTSPRFSVNETATGNWRLTIQDHSPSTGVLIVSPEGGTAQNQDNIVSYRPDGDGWIIQSRDLPANPPNPQSPSGPIASFVFIPAAITTTLVSPQADAINLGASPVLQVAVSNSAPGSLSVEFFGRPANPPGEDFTIALLPDTQMYSASLNGGLPAMFYAQAEWIVTNRVQRNIAYVAHLGDISQNGDIKSGNSNLAEWRVATNAMYRLENASRTLLANGIPYGMAVGNHDQEPIGTPDGTSIFYNQFFGIPHFAGRPYYGGSYSAADNDNHFDLFSAGGLDFVVLYFEYDSDANPDVLAWGNRVLQTNANRRAIVVTHNFGNTQTPLNFSAQGAAIYNALKTNSNLFLMLAGHVTGEGSRVDTFNGNVVRTYVQDFQGWTNGGDGFMRTMEFSPRDNQVVVQTFSPYTGEFETDANSEFFFEYDMQLPSVPFQRIGTVTNVSPGTVASLPWPSRQPETHYEWYAVVTDASNNSTRGATWRFRTGTNATPTASPRVVNVVGDRSTNLTFVATDGDGDGLTYRTNSKPNHGLLYNFNPATGTFTYQPTHGFRGLDQVNFQASDSFATTPSTALYLNVVAPDDGNTNGLPDYWESQYGVSDPNTDQDGDGASNIEEYLANTNATNSLSVLFISNVTRNANGHVTLLWPSVGSTRYRVQFSNGGIAGSLDGNFTDILRPLELEMDPSPDDVPSQRSFVDDYTLTGGSGTNRARYYRIKVVQ